MFGRVTAFLYGLFCYAMFLGSFVYAVGFLGNFGVPKPMDSGARLPLMEALAVDALLLTLFAVQHSVMARQWFKRMWTRVVPKPVERSTYVLFSSLALILLFWKWEAIPGVVWNAGDGAGKAIAHFFYGLGWLIVLASTFLINHFDLFGLRQVWLNLRGREYTTLQFRTPVFYQYVRHPLYCGWLMVFWSTPVMSSAHLVFAVATTLYILLAIQFEERDLVTIHPEYAEYRKRVPMLVPRARSAGELAGKGRDDMEVA